MNFVANVTAAAGGTHVEMAGHLDEGARMPAVEALGPGALTIDLAGVSLINSLGCRRWLSWIGAATAHVTEVELARCSFAIIQQINVLGGFLPPGARVTSFFVPYECPHCGHAARVLHKVEAAFDANAVPDGMTCPACGERMVLEVVRQTYFKFLGAS